jgi:hypothetical protein
MVYKVHHARSGGVLHGARPGWLSGVITKSDLFKVRSLEHKKFGSESC